MIELINRLEEIRAKQVTLIEEERATSLLIADAVAPNDWDWHEDTDIRAASFYCCGRMVSVNRHGSCGFAIVDISPMKELK